MDFSTSKPIYRQITEFCYARILSGEWKPLERIPSVKELAVTMTVNTRTVLKAYEDMENAGAIFQKRGLGFFVAQEACSVIAAELRAEFFSDTLPALRSRMQMLGITPAELLEALGST